MSTLFGGASSSSASTTVGDLKADVALDQPPTDSVSDLAFSPAPNGPDYLAVSSWDAKVRIYEIDGNGRSQGRHVYEHSQPVLNVDFSKDGTKIASAGADKNVKVCDLASQQDMVVGTHDQPVRTVRFFDSGNGPMVVSGSWDKTVKYWDLRQQQPAATLTCQERVYTMDVRDNLCVVGTADRYINVIDLKNPTKFYKTLQSPLKWQTRVVSCFTDSAGFAIGSIEGRCAIQYVEDKDSSSNFSFKCHRDPPRQQRYQRLRRQRYLVPPRPRHLQHGRLRRYVPLLGQGRQAPSQGLPQRGRQHHGHHLQQERKHLCLRR
ncbi:RNA export factor gle2 [Fusarium falciforme]|nr:RNA export factor gle2 [Fusarium falciforme]